MNESDRKLFCEQKANEIAEILKVDSSNKIHVRLFFAYLIASI